MDLGVVSGVELDSDILSAWCSLAQINSNSYSLVCVCFWLGLSLERKQ
jgi:hypothetical protein